jgi:hypothetical protein
LNGNNKKPVLPQPTRMEVWTGTQKIVVTRAPKRGWKIVVGDHPPVYRPSFSEAMEYVKEVQ